MKKSWAILNAHLSLVILTHFDRSAHLHDFPGTPKLQKGAGTQKKLTDLGSFRTEVY